MNVLLGCIADDFTGATDLANNLVRRGMRTVQTIGIPGEGFDPGDVDAIVVALKSRTNPADEAARESVAALNWLQGQGCRQFFFKYCSTFDSTDRGNIGPVADALLDELGADFAIACPAFPVNGRTVYRGYLYAGSLLLNESGMEQHPLTPMTDANLVRVLGRQTDGAVGLVGYETLEGGVDAVRACIEGLRPDHRYAICDTLNDAHLETIAAAVADHPLVTGGSGLALGLPGNFRRQGLLEMRTDAADLPAIAGHALVVSGSCSRATRAQVAHMAGLRPAFFVDPLALARGDDVVAEAVAWASTRISDGPVLVYATAESESVAAAQQQLGMERAGALVEKALAAITQQLVGEHGVRRLVVAGGETAGAVVQALGIGALRIGPQIDPGVPWTAALVGHENIVLALKSGNFGSEDFFLKSFRELS